MTQKYYLILPLFLLLFLISNKSGAQTVQVLDSVDVFYVDNTSDNNTGTTGTFMNDPKYREFPQTNPASVTNVSIYGWWSNISSIYYGGNHRRASRFGSGDNSGAHAHFYASLQYTDYYLVYHHMNSGNATTNAYVTFKRFGEGIVADSMRYNMLENNVIGGTGGSWKPLGIITLYAADSALTVDIGLDSLGSNTLRCDAIALVRSRSTGPDIEFGNRRFTRLLIDAITGDTTANESFYRHRAPLEFPATTFKFHGYTDKKVTLYNLGDATLTVTGYGSQTNRFSIVTPAPFTIASGGKKDVTVRFAPLGEEVTIDTLYIESNDPLEPKALLPVRGEGINYNFILNASASGSEPHWNAPPPGGIYEEVGASWLTSTPTPWPYPIPGGNIGSRVNTSSDVGVSASYRFRIPDTLAGKYFLEYSGPAGSSNAAQNATIDVVTPFVADTQRVTGFNSRAVTTLNLWARIGGNRVFDLLGGGESVVRFTNPNQGVDFLRTDLLRVRLVPISPTIATNLGIGALLNYGSVSIYDTIRLAQGNYQRSFEISSNGETPLRIDTIYLGQKTVFSLDNLPTFPLTLPAIDGKYVLFATFLPGEIRSYNDTVYIRSNDPRDSLIAVRLFGQGVGTGLTVDDENPTTYIYPAQVQSWIGTPDPQNMDKWYRISGSGGVNDNRLFGYIYFTPSTGVKTVEWFPYFPFKPGSSTFESDSFDVFITSPIGSSISSPRAKYIVKHFNGTDTVIINQNSTTYGGHVGESGEVFLGRYTFLRGGQDSRGSGTVFGSVELLNDTALVSAYYKDSIVNTARRDSFVLRADALLLRQAGITGIIAEPNMLPVEFSLSQNYPNPFNPTTQIKFSLPHDAKIELKIYDILGKEVATLANGEYKAGFYTVEWNGRNNFGVPVSSGMYIYRINAGKFMQTKKMMMLK